MSRYEHDNWGDIQDYIFAKGIITAVDSENDTADVTVEGYLDGSDIPIFYHCSNDVEERDNGAIEGAAAGFSADDEVMVMCEADTGSPVRIIGFMDGIKSCCWEPWGDTWCANHRWSMYQNKPLSAQRLCTSDDEMFSEYTLTDGVLSFSVTANLGTTRNSLWIGGAAYALEEFPENTVQQMRFKISAEDDFLPGQSLQGVYLSISFDKLNYFGFNYISLGLSSNNSYYPLHSPPYYFIGDNNGEEQVVVFSDYGFDDVMIIGFGIYSNLPYQRSCSWACDYINFR